MEEQNVPAENENQAEEVTLDVTEETTTPSENVEETFDWKAEALKQKEYAQNQKIRAEKAERLAKTPKVEVKPDASKPNMSTRDYIALVNAKINEEDIQEVEDYAKYKGISIADALKVGVVKSLLAEKEEMRKTAQATNVSNARRSSAQVSPETILAKARKGDVPDGEDEIEKLVRSRKSYNR